MARMIPAMPDERTPPGEREVFNRLADGPDDWIVLHSLDLAPWNRGLRTEIDFVIIVPEAGIVCAEVKSHDNISFDGSRWYPNTITRSPFKQASDGRFAFHRRLGDLAPYFRHIPVVHCCFFPRSVFHLSGNLSVQPWELIDSRVFENAKDGGMLGAEIKSRLLRSIEADGHIAPLERRLNHEEVESILKLCVPVQKNRIDKRDEIARREREVERVLRDQQRPVLRLAMENQRLLIRGGAGTGKTLIAMELARRVAESGLRVALLCFNQLVGDWMMRQMAQGGVLPPNLIVGRAIRVMMEMCGIELPANLSAEYWSRDLPLLLEERITDPEFKGSVAFDYLILDEAQDLAARPHLWQCIFAFVAGGVQSGRYALFGDFDNQVLMEHDNLGETIKSLEMAGQPVRWTLTENCRNYRIVGDTAVKLGGICQSVYSGYLRTGGSVRDYDIFFYSDESEQLRQIQEWLTSFKDQGFKASEITLLSFRADDASAAARLAASGHRLCSARQPGTCTSYATVHAFKGMENKAIIITDVVCGEQGFYRELLYTGMTRATESVRILCSKASQKVLLDWLEKSGTTCKTEQS